jgi:hypothetical protein
MNNQEHHNPAFVPQLQSFEGSDAQVVLGSSAEGPIGNETASQSGKLIINADDWGRNQETTTRILGCVTQGSVSSVSAMVFMQDSERAAGVAREQDIDAGLHLNFTTAFSAPNGSVQLVQHQQRIARCLRRHRLAQALFYPTLVRSFEYVVSAQIEEFCRLYGRMPQRLDGHHHMHLCANVLVGRLLPPVTVVRRNFSFEAGEKSFTNRLYRRVVDRILVRRHRLTDFFFSLAPLNPHVRLQRIFSLARHFAVEVETHPVNPDEYQFLSSGEISRLAGEVRIARGFAF